MSWRGIWPEDNLGRGIKNSVGGGMTISTITMSSAGDWWLAHGDTVLVDGEILRVESIFSETDLQVNPWWRWRDLRMESFFRRIVLFLDEVLPL